MNQYETTSEAHYAGNLNCPHCRRELSMIITPDLSDWGGVPLWVCFNNFCSYFLSSWKTLKEQGVHAGYRYYFDESGGAEGPMLIMSIDAYVNCIVDVMERTEEEVVCEHDELRSAINEARITGDIQLSNWLQELLTIKYPNRS
jgi:hypothetical protein